MKLTAAIAASLTSLLATTTSAAPNANYINLIAIHSGSPIHLSSLNASGAKIWIGKATSASCPAAQIGAKNCPADNSTNFIPPESTGGLAMGAEVPGGQEVYIDHSTGAVMFTVAHSGEVPTGDTTGGWTYTGQVPGNKHFGELSHKHGLLACPKGNAYQVFVELPGLTFASDCLGFLAYARNETGPDAWQYNN